MAPRFRDAKLERPGTEELGDSVFAEGEKLGAYLIQRRIGIGGMGEVYLAEHVHIGRKAAIKVLLPELSSRPDVVSRFFNEARATGLLRHPHIVEILDCDIHASGRAYIVMELLEGETVGQCLARIGSFAHDATTAAAIAGQIATGLSAAHAKGIVHRDLKPDNLFLTSTPDADAPVRVKILDFGIAKLFGDGVPEMRRTRTGSLLGTPLYMSPEQCRGAGAVDHRADIYSLGCITFELLAGRPPFVREGHGELIIAHNSEPPPLIGSLVPAVTPPLAALVARMLAKNAADRPQSMNEVVQAIEALLGVPASQLGMRMKIPDGFLRHAVPDQLAEAHVASPTGDTVWAAAPDRKASDHPSRTTVPSPIPASSPGPTPVPRTLLQSKNHGSDATKLLSQDSTTLAQSPVAVSTAATAPPRSTWRGMKIGIAFGFGMALAAGIAIIALWSSATAPATSDEPGDQGKPAAVVAAPPVPVPSAPALPAPARFVSVDLEHQPAGLTAWLDGKTTGVPVSVPYGPAPHELRLEAPGFKPEVVQVTGTRDKSIVLNMRPLPAAPAAGEKTDQATASDARTPAGRADGAARATAKKKVKPSKTEGFFDL